MPFTWQEINSLSYELLTPTEKQAAARVLVDEEAPQAVSDSLGMALEDVYRCAFTAQASFFMKI